MRYLVLFHISILALAIDIVQIDVGTSKTFSGVLNLKRTELVHESEHGTHMATALESELKKQRSRRVDAVQFVWDYKGHSRHSLLATYIKAVKAEPKIVSISMGGPVPDPLEEAYLYALFLSDTVIVAAAGNNGGGRQYFPANYKNPCIVNVGTRFAGKKASYSNDADTWLEYNMEDPAGTSASAARMAAIALQIRRQNPQLSCDKVVLTLQMLYGH